MEGNSRSGTLKAAGIKNLFIFFKDSVNDLSIMYKRKVSRIMNGYSLLPMELPETCSGKQGKIVDILLRPHDLRRFAATYASRSGTPMKLSAKSFCVMQIYQRHKGIWEKSVTLKL